MNVLGRNVHLGRHFMQGMCAVAFVAVILSIVLGAPVLALLGGLFCAAMMIGMVWMMVGMAHRHGR